MGYSYVGYWLVGYFAAYWACLGIEVEEVGYLRRLQRRAAGLGTLPLAPSRTCWVPRRLYSLSAQQKNTCWVPRRLYSLSAQQRNTCWVPRRLYSLSAQQRNTCWVPRRLYSLSAQQRNTCWVPRRLYSLSAQQRNTCWVPRRLYSLSAQQRKNTNNQKPTITQTLTIKGLALMVPHYDTPKYAIINYQKKKYLCSHKNRQIYIYFLQPCIIKQILCKLYSCLYYYK